MTETISTQPQAPEINHEALAEYASAANDRHMDAREQMSEDLAKIGGQPVAKEITAHATVNAPRAIDAAPEVAAEATKFDLKISN
jgi:hypothetical protein